MIEVTDLTKVFTGHPPVINGVSFHLKPRQILAVIGRSGSGKSTLLDILMGLQKPTTGEVKIRPNIRLGYVFQRPALLPWAKVWQNVALPLKINRLKKQEILLRVDQALGQVGLSYARDLFPSQLSGGMAQRVAIARALVQQPDVLLMDEPFSALDPILRENMNINLLKLWQASQTSIIFVTHSIEEAVILSDRVFILEDGGFIADFEIGLGRPRTFDTFKSKAFSDQVREIHQKLPDQPNLPRKLAT